MPEPTSEGVKVNESPVVAEVKTLTSLVLVEGPFWRAMVQPLWQLLNLRVKLSPSLTTKSLFKNWGWAAMATVARAEKTTAYFIVNGL